MKYLLMVSVVINILLIAKIVAMRLSVKEIASDFAHRADLQSNTLIGVSSRDKQIRTLAKEINETLVKLRDAFNRYRLGDAEVKTAITNITHDLRTPLTAISGYIELIEKSDDKEEKDRYFSIIKERVGHMKKLTDELFEYSIITAGEPTEEKQEVNVNKVLENSLMNFYPALKERGIEPEVNITEEVVVRTLYPSYTERIIGNLISNALKYSDGDLEVTLDEKGLFKIANSSKELSNVDVYRLFDRFYTVESARNYSTGLGLSIVRVLSQRMDLSLNAKYEEGRLVIEIGF
jgi:signal transduction histidine kinase